MWNNNFQSKHLLPNKAGLWQVVMWQHYCSTNSDCIGAAKCRKSAIVLVACHHDICSLQDTFMWTGFILMMTCALHAAAKAACSFTQRADTYQKLQCSDVVSDMSAASCSPFFTTYFLMIGNSTHVAGLAVHHHIKLTPFCLLQHVCNFLLCSASCLEAWCCCIT